MKIILEIPKSCTDFVFRFHTENGKLIGIGIESRGLGGYPEKILHGEKVENASVIDGCWELSKIKDPKGLLERFKKSHPLWDVGCTVRY